MSAPVKQNISRSLWRFFEISLFFLVSVLGYNFLAKTTSFNAKSKSNEHAPGVVMVQSFFDEDASMLYLSSRFQSSENPSSLNGTSFHTIFYQKSGSLTKHLPGNSTLSDRSSFIPFSSKLFLQNKVLLI